MSVYQISLPSPPTQQPIPCKGMAQQNQNSTSKENSLPSNSNSNKRKSTLSSHYQNGLRIDTSVALSKMTPASPTSQSSSPQPTSASSQTTHSPHTKVSNNTFVHKLYHMLSDAKNSPLISWNESGFSFTIRNVQGFSQNVLPLHFRHSNFSSFVRQLNMYGFHKANKSSSVTKGTENQIWEFFHPKFLRGKPHLLEEIRRKPLESESWRASAAIIQEQNRLNYSRHSPYGQQGIYTTAGKGLSNAVSASAAATSNASKRSSLISASAHRQQQAAAAAAAAVRAQTKAHAHAQVPSATGQIQVNTQQNPPTPVYIQNPNDLLSQQQQQQQQQLNMKGNIMMDPLAALPPQPQPSMMPQANPQIQGYNIIQVPSQTVTYQTPPPPPPPTPSSSVTPPPLGNATAMPTPMGMIPPQQTIVETINGPAVIQEMPNTTAVNPTTPINNQDVMYNIQILQMQNQDIHNRLNEFQNDMKNIIQAYSESRQRIEYQQSMIEQLMNKTSNGSTQEVATINPSTLLDNHTMINQQYVNPQMINTNGNTLNENGQIIQSPINTAVTNNHLIQQSPIISTQMLDQNNFINGSIQPPQQQPQPQQQQPQPPQTLYINDQPQQPQQQPQTLYINDQTQQPQQQNVNSNATMSTTTSIITTTPLSTTTTTNDDRQNPLSNNVNGGVVYNTSNIYY